MLTTFCRSLQAGTPRPIADLGALVCRYATLSYFATNMKLAELYQHLFRRLHRIRQRQRALILDNSDGYADHGSRAHR